MVEGLTRGGGVDALITKLTVPMSVYGYIHPCVPAFELKLEAILTTLWYTTLRTLI